MHKSWPILDPRDQAEAMGDGAKPRGTTDLVLRCPLLCPQHVEKLDLGAFVKFTDESPRGSSGDPGIYFNLVLRNQEIKFKVDPLEGGGLVGDPASPLHSPLTQTNMESCRV